ncbi:MAG: hypothetical protein LBF76_02820 [Holosporales bacterium]|jgi:hypothetical protein|nr:hypothetical protein [Holosporales bacterium]
MDEVTMRLEEIPPPVHFANLDIQAANDDNEPAGSRFKKSGIILCWVLSVLGGLYLITWLVTA